MTDQAIQAVAKQKNKQPKDVTVVDVAETALKEVAARDQAIGQMKANLNAGGKVLAAKEEELKKLQILGAAVSAARDELKRKSEQNDDNATKQLVAMTQQLSLLESQLNNMRGNPFAIPENHPAWDKANDELELSLANHGAGTKTGYDKRSAAYITADRNMKVAYKKMMQRRDEYWGAYAKAVTFGPVVVKEEEMLSAEAKATVVKEKLALKHEEVKQKEEMKSKKAAAKANSKQKKLEMIQSVMGVSVIILIDVGQQKTDATDCPHYQNASFTGYE